MAADDDGVLKCRLASKFHDLGSERQRPVRAQRRAPRAFAAELNARPRKTLGWQTPTAVLADLVSRADTAPQTRRG